QFVRMLAAAPSLRRCALVTLGGTIHELARVDRASADQGVRIASDAELAQPATAAEADFARQAASASESGAFVSPVELAPERAPDGSGAALLSVAAPLAGPDNDTLVAVIVMTLDLGPAFARIRAAVVPPRPMLLAALPPRYVSVIDEQGRYLVRADGA